MITTLQYTTGDPKTYTNTHTHTPTQSKHTNAHIHGAHTNTKSSKHTTIRS